jgi:hypothetical protein
MSTQHHAHPGQQSESGPSKRFVQAEVVGYDDFVRVGSMKEAKASS